MTAMNPGFVKQAVPPVKASKVPLKCHDYKEGSSGTEEVVAEAAVLGNPLQCQPLCQYHLLQQLQECTGENISRRDFILKLATALQQKHFDQKTAKQQAAAAQPGFSAAPSDACKRKQCQVAKCNKNKTSDICAQCERAVCGKCTGKVEKRYICVDCST
ncbi:UNVERIFIED_CONTAM: hypothetical protein FKN15_006872 [Acipenser sinensis]